MKSSSSNVFGSLFSYSYFHLFFTFFLSWLTLDVQPLPIAIQGTLSSRRFFERLISLHNGCVERNDEGQWTVNIRQKKNSKRVQLVRKSQRSVQTDRKNVSIVTACGYILWFVCHTPKWQLNWHFASIQEWDGYGRLQWFKLIFGWRFEANTAEVEVW